VAAFWAAAKTSRGSVVPATCSVQATPRCVVIFSFLGGSGNPAARPGKLPDYWGATGRRQRRKWQQGRDAGLRGGGVAARLRDPSEEVLCRLLTDAPWRELAVMPRDDDSRLPASDALTPGAMGAGIRPCSSEADAADTTSRDAKKPAFRRGTRSASTSVRRRPGP
jgi:hypothetical protein